MRNLLGRLHRRSSEELLRAAAFWRVPLFGRNTGQHIGALYRVMTDVRAVRDVWTQLGPVERAIIGSLADDRVEPITLAELSERLDADEDAVQTAVDALIGWSILSREGEAAELPIGQSPRVFIPRELASGFGRVMEELAAGNQSSLPLKRLLEMRDDADLEESARKWGIDVIPGIRRRHELVTDILKHVDQPNRHSAVIRHLKPPAKAIWDAMQAADGEAPIAFDDVVAAAGLSVEPAPLSLAIEHGARLRGALEALESSLLVVHTWLEDDQRALFIPQEVRHPGSIPTTMPLEPLQPVARDAVNPDPPRHPFALAWDLLTVVRDVLDRGAPAWVPGERVSLTWQRQMNGRLWFRGKEVPAEGYAGLMLYLAATVGVLERSTRGSGSERNAVKLAAGAEVRQWRSLSFPEQTALLRDAWLAADTWIEAAERQQITIWGADWPSFRRKLLGAIALIDQEEWLLVPDLARRLAEQEPSMLGATFSSSAAQADRNQTRVESLAMVIEQELLTAMTWFGYVETGTVSNRGVAVRVLPAAPLAAAGTRATVSLSQSRHARALSIDHQGVIRVHQIAPLHIWSLSAFADAEDLGDQPVYQLRPASIGRALGAGFDLDQITTYLEQQSGEPLPDPLSTKLREWTAGYRRVRLRRAITLRLDTKAGLADLRSALEEAGLEILTTIGQDVIALMPPPEDDAQRSEEKVFSILRSAGYVGKWTRPPGTTTES